jgi:spermidine synthase
LARKYFRLPENDRLTIQNKDGRALLNKAPTGVYDVIYGDAYRSSFSIPYQLTTIEAMQKAHDSLTENGVMMINVISGIEGKTGRFLRAEYRTLKEVFPAVYVFPVTDPSDRFLVQNIIVIASKSSSPPDYSRVSASVRHYAANLLTQPPLGDEPVLTDDLAPVDQYINDI